MKRKALVTGGTGAIGRSVVEYLLNDGWHVRVLSRNEERVVCEAETVIGDITDPAALEHAVDGVDAVFHCAGEKHNEERMMHVNVDGTANIVAAAKKSGIQYFCHMSSVSVYGVNHTGRIDEMSQTNPITTYSKSKLESEKIVLSNAPCRNTCLLRVGNVVNRHDSGVLRPVIINGLRSFVRISILGARGTHMVHADDVASAVLFFFEKPLNAPDVFNVTYDGDGSTTLLDAYAIWLDACNGRRLRYVRPALEFSNKYFGCLYELVYADRILSSSVSFRSDRLHNSGFSFPLGFKGAIESFFGRFME